MRRSSILIGLAIPLVSLLSTLSCAFEIDYDRLAVVYGISDYEDYGLGTGDLNFCHLDAEEIYSALFDQGYSVTARTDLDATYDNLLADLEWVRENGRPADLFVFFFSGHGCQSLPGGGEPLEADSNREGILLNTGGTGHYTLGDDELGSLIGRIRCSKKIVIIDACNSGGFIGNSLETDSTPPNYQGEEYQFPDTLVRAITLYTNYATGSCDISPDNALVISASGEQEFSYELGEPYCHGIFTYYLLDSIEKGDYNRDGYVTVFEASGYAREKIEEDWNVDLEGSSMQFAPRISGGPLDFILFKKQ